MSTKASATESLSLTIETNLYITNKSQKELYHWIAIHLHTRVQGEQRRNNLL